MQGDRTENTWEGLEDGSPVKIEGIRGNFVFKSVRMDGETPVVITVARAKTDKRMGTRMVTPDRVTIAHGKYGVRRVWLSEEEKVIG